MEERTAKSIYLATSKIRSFGIAAMSVSSVGVATVGMGLPGMDWVLLTALIFFTIVWFVAVCVSIKLIDKYKIQGCTLERWKNELRAELNRLHTIRFKGADENASELCRQANLFRIRRQKSWLD